MKKMLLSLLALFTVYLGSYGQDLYVSPSGSASNSGSSISAPTTLANALATITAGGTIYMRGGTYNLTASVIIAESNSGTSSATKKLFAYGSEVPIISFAGMAIATSNRGVILDGSYWHLRGLIIESAGDNGLLLSGDNNTIESCIFRRNADSGLQLSRYNTSYNSISQWPSNNLILNCEAYDNKDPDNEDADGFAAKLTSGNGNVFRNCVAHHNIDDGWDLYTKSDTGPIGPVTLENCIAHSNGILTNGSTSGNGDKNGFKLGGEDISVNHIVRRCIAFNNGKHGFTYNRNLGTIEMTNNTSYDNTERNFNFDGGTSVFKNNLSYLSGSNDRIIGTATAPNSFQGASGSFTVTAADFVTLTQGANASPTSNGFLNLASGSDLINGGVTSTGISYNGSAPDLGAIESGSITTNYTLTTSASPSAGGSVTRSPNATSYASGTVVTLTASPASGYTFTGWSGDVTGTATSITVTMTANRTVTANFTNSTNTYTLTTTASPTAGGTITRSPNATTYVAGTVVTLTATPASGYTFTGWSGGASGTNATTTVTMNANTSVTANFTNSTGTYTLTTTANPGAGGAITRSPNATTYAAGTVVTLTATPASGYSFSSWSGGASGTSATTTVTMNANTSVTANFTTSNGGTTLRIDDKSGTGTGYCSANGSRQNTYTGADGGYYINLSNSSGQGITWAVSAGAAGTYNIRWRYSNAGTQSATTARVLVNGVQVNASVAFPKTSTWSSWTTTANIPVTLVAGANKIRLETTVSSEFAMIDWIEIIGTNPTEASCSAATGSRITTQGGEAGTNLLVEGAPVVVPNPTTGVSSVRFTIASQEKVVVNLFAADGRLVSTLANRLFSAGTHAIPVDYKGLQKGVYFISVSYGGKQRILQNILTR